MTSNEREAALMEAISHLSKAVQALQRADCPELQHRAYVLTNDVLKHRTIIATEAPACHS